jgi:hypothetical protein
MTPSSHLVSPHHLVSSPIISPSSHHHLTIISPSSHHHLTIISPSSHHHLTIIAAAISSDTAGLDGLEEGVCVICGGGEVTPPSTSSSHPISSSHPLSSHLTSPHHPLHPLTTPSTSSRPTPGLHRV